MPIPKWAKEKAEEVNAKADAKVDSWLRKLMDSKWTAAIVGGAAGFVALMILSRLF